MVGGDERRVDLRLVEKVMIVRSDRMGRRPVLAG
jgi:hypothetical protein